MFDRKMDRKIKNTEMDNVYQIIGPKSALCCENNTRMQFVPSAYKPAFVIDELINSCKKFSQF